MQLLFHFTLHLLDVKFYFRIMIFNNNISEEVFAVKCYYLKQSLDKMWFLYHGSVKGTRILTDYNLF